MLLSSCARLLPLVLGALCLPGKLPAEDWPQWRGPQRDGHAASSARVPSTLPPDPRTVWRIRVGEGFASPVISGANAYYFDNVDGKETLHAIRIVDHQELWRAAIDDVFQDEQGPPGPRSTPVVDGDRIYAQSGKGELQCLRLADGRRIWRVNYLKEFGSAFLGEDSKIPGAAEHGYTAAPLIEGNQIIACVGGTNSAGIVSFEKRTGRLVWKSQNDLAAYAAPIVATLAGLRQIVCFTVEGAIGLDPGDGSLLWRVPLTTSFGRNCATPVTVDDWVVVGSYQAGLVGIKILPDQKNRLKAERVWVNKAAAMNFSSPVAVGQYVYGLGPEKNLVCVEAATGKVMWSKTGYINTAPNTAHAAFLVLGKNLLACTDGGELLLIAAEPAGCREIGRAQVCGMNWCNPAYAGGRLFLRDGLRAGGNLYCLELLPDLNVRQPPAK